MTNSEKIKAYLDKGLWVEVLSYDKKISKIVNILTNTKEPYFVSETGYRCALTAFDDVERWKITPIPRPFKPYEVGDKVIVLSTNRIALVEFMLEDISRGISYKLKYEDDTTYDIIGHYYLAPYFEN